MLSGGNALLPRSNKEGNDLFVGQVSNLPSVSLE